MRYIEGPGGNVTKELRLYHRRMILPNYASLTLKAFGVPDGSRVAAVPN